MTLRLWDLDPARLRASSAPRGDRAWPRVELLRRPLGRTAPRGRRRAAWRRCPSLRRRRRGRPVDVLQVPARRSRSALRRERVRAERVAAAAGPRRRAARPGPARRSSKSTPSTCPTRRAPSYRAEHVKTSIGIQALDPDAPAGSATSTTPATTSWQGEDFAGVFRLEGHLDRSRVPAAVRRGGQAGCQAAADRSRAASRPRSRLLRAHLARRPAANPFRRYAARFPQRPCSGSPANRSRRFHSYAFATLRQCGAAFELAAAYLRWLEAGGERGLERAAEACELIATTPRRCSSRRRARSARASRSIRRRCWTRWPRRGTRR